MPNKLRKVIAAVKDQTSISIAIVSSPTSANLSVAILKATTHEEVPAEDRYVKQILVLTSSSRHYAATCVNALARRIARTNNWIVALKSLTLIFKILQHGDPHFAQEVIRYMKRGAKLLNLSNFRDDSNSCPWDYTAFVRTFALYLDERLDYCITDKLQDCTSPSLHQYHLQNQGSADHLKDMEPEVLLDKIAYWQRLMERVIATKPTGPARSNRLVHICLYSVLRESFDLYHDISNALSLIVEKFLQLSHFSRDNAFLACTRASKQFHELADIYSLCKGLGVGTISAYPVIEKIPKKLLDTLQEFLKDNVDSNQVGRLLLDALPAQNAASSEQSVGPEKARGDQCSVQDGDGVSDRCAVEDKLIDVKEISTTESSSSDQENKSGLLDMKESNTSLSCSFDRDLLSNLDLVVLKDSLQQNTKEEGSSTSDNVLFNDRPQQLIIQQCNSHQSRVNDHSCLSGVLFDDKHPSSLQQQQDKTSCLDEGRKECWEIVLVETPDNMLNRVKQSSNGSMDLMHLQNFKDQPFAQHYHPQNYSNPFFQGGNESQGSFNSRASLPPPTFNGRNPHQVSTLPPEADPFSPHYCLPPPTAAHVQIGSGTFIKPQLAVHPQQWWLQL